MRSPVCAFFISSRACARSPIHTSASAAEAVTSSSGRLVVDTRACAAGAACAARMRPRAFTANMRTRFESSREVPGTGSGSTYLSFATSAGMARASPRSPSTSATRAYVPAAGRLFSFAQARNAGSWSCAIFTSGPTAGPPMRNSANELSGRNETLCRSITSPRASAGIAAGSPILPRASMARLTSTGGAAGSSTTCDSSGTASFALTRPNASTAARRTSPSVARARRSSAGAARGSPTLPRASAMRALVRLAARAAESLPAPTGVSRAVRRASTSAGPARSWSASAASSLTSGSCRSAATRAAACFAWSLRSC